MRQVLPNMLPSYEISSTILKMELFGIATDVLAFLSISVKVLVGLRQFKDTTKDATTSKNALIIDISGLRRVLQSMEETFQEL